MESTTTVNDMKKSDRPDSDRTRTGTTCDRAAGPRPGGLPINTMCVSLATRLHGMVRQPDCLLLAPLLMVTKFMNLWSNLIDIDRFGSIFTLL